MGINVMVSHNAPEVQLSQSPNGTYTMVAAGSRGIRIYETESLQLLRVYGEGVALHGKNVVWKSCFFVPVISQQTLLSSSSSSSSSLSKNSTTTPETLIRKHKRDGTMWMECEDAITFL